MFGKNGNIVNLYFFKFRRHIKNTELLLGYNRSEATLNCELRIAHCEFKKRRTDYGFYTFASSHGIQPA